MTGVYPRMPRASEAEVAKARELREQGDKLEQIAASMGRSVDWVWKATKGISPSRIRYRIKVEYKNFPGFPSDPALALRVRNLAKRGFDVPPSKQADWDVLGKAGYTVEERKAALKLE